MVRLHAVHPQARRLGWIEGHLAANAGDIPAIGRVIARIIQVRPSVFLLGAGMSRGAGMPTAREYCTVLALAILAQPPVEAFLSDNSALEERWSIRLADLEFDVLLALFASQTPIATRDCSTYSEAPSPAVSMRWFSE